jgi:hypothetical protein
LISHFIAGVARSDDPQTLLTSRSSAKLCVLQVSVPKPAMAVRIVLAIAAQDIHEQFGRSDEDVLDLSGLFAHVRSPSKNEKR